MLQLLRDYFNKILKFSAQIDPLNQGLSSVESSSDLNHLHALVRGKSWDALENTALELLLLDSPPSDQLELVAYSLQQGGFLEPAAHIASKAAEIFPGNWTFAFLAGVTLSGLGRNDEAVIYLKRAVAIAPNDLQSTRELMQALAKTQGIEVDQGLSSVESSSDLNHLHALVRGKSWDALENTALELLLLDSPPSDQLELVAYSLQQGGFLEPAAHIASKAAEIFPGNWTFAFLAGVTLSGLGRNDEAVIYLKRAVAIAPNDLQSTRELMQALAKTQGIEVAVAEYEKHLDLIGRKADLSISQITTVRDWANEVGALIIEAGEAENIPFAQPHIWGSPKDSDVIYASSNKPYVVEINNARIFSNSSIILASDGSALSDTAGHPEFGWIVDLAYEAIVIARNRDKLLIDFSGFKVREIEAGIYLSGLASNAYGHWMPEFLPKLQFLQEHPNFANFPIIVDAGMPKSHFDHLKRLVENKLIKIYPNESFLCRNLLVSPAPTFFPVETYPHDIPVHKFPGLSPRAMRFLRGTKMTIPNKPGDRRIFLARKNMKWRRLVNEDEISEYLISLGFEIIYIEELTVDEQINLFQQAQYIVAPNGSALLNLIFANTKIKLLVLIQPDLYNWGTFQGPMDALGYESVCVSGDYVLGKNQKHSDYHIPVQRIRDALSDLGIVA